MSEAIFVGQGQSAGAWYRCYMPAMVLGHDWVGLEGQPPNFRMSTGQVHGRTQQPNFNDYEIAVVQQPGGRAWLNAIRKLQDRGIKVVYEIDDYVHAIRKLEGHSSARYFTKDRVEGMEMCMRVCDAVVVSTEYLARRYRKFNRNVHVCSNGVDLARYALTRPPRPTVNIGWAGATGHRQAVMAWLPAVANVMRRHPETCFISIGLNYADVLGRMVSPARTLSIPWTLIEQYPAAMTTFDIALAPSGKGAFYQGKSDLRWVEAGALSIPTIATPLVYPDIEDGANGWWADSAEEAEEAMETLVADAPLRQAIGENAREYVEQNRDARITAQEWAAVFHELQS